MKGVYRFKDKYGNEYMAGYREASSETIVINTTAIGKGGFERACEGVCKKRLRSKDKLWKR